MQHVFLSKFFLYPNNTAEEDSLYEQNIDKLKNKKLPANGIDKLKN